MLGPLPVGLLGGTVEPPTFSGYYSGHTYGVLGLEWDDLEPLGVTGSGLTFSVVSGSLPPGLSLNPSTGVISGTPVSAGVNPVVVRCSNGAGFVDSPNYNFTFMDTTTSNSVVWYAAVEGQDINGVWPNGFNKCAIDGRLELVLASGGGGGGGKGYYETYVVGPFGGGGFTSQIHYGGGGGGVGRLIQTFTTPKHNGSPFFAYLGLGGDGGTAYTNGSPGGASYLTLTPDIPIGDNPDYEFMVAGGGGGQSNGFFSEETDPFPPPAAQGGTAGGGNWGMPGWPGSNGPDANGFAQNGSVKWSTGGAGGYGVDVTGVNTIINDMYITGSRFVPGIGKIYAVAAASSGRLRTGAGGGGGAVILDLGSDNYGVEATPSKLHLAYGSRGGDGLLAFVWQNP